MGRPIKKGLVYFYNDVDFYQDIKIRKLIRRKGGQAATVYHILLCEIYRHGYFLEWDNDIPFLVSEISGFEEDYIKDVIDYCLEVGLFDKGLYDSGGVITSSGIQQRYFAAGKDAKRKVGSNLPYLLITLDNGNMNGVQVMDQSTDLPDAGSVTLEETIVNTEENDINSEETAVNYELSTQRKEKKRKYNTSLRSILSPPPPPTPARARDGGDSPDNLDDLSFDGPLTVSSAVNLLKADRDWLLQMQRKFRLESDQILRWLDSFVVDCDCRGKQEHEDLADVKQHFNDWMAKMLSGGNMKKSKKGAVRTGVPTVQERWVQCKAELCRAVSADVAGKSFDLVRFMSFDPSVNELLLEVPGRETCEFMEAHLVNVMSAVMPKYFGSQIQLKYHVLDQAKEPAKQRQL